MNLEEFAKLLNSRRGSESLEDIIEIRDNIKEEGKQDGVEYIVPEDPEGRVKIKVYIGGKKI